MYTDDLINTEYDPEVRILTVVDPECEIIEQAKVNNEDYGRELRAIFCKLNIIPDDESLNVIKEISKCLSKGKVYWLQDRWMIFQKTILLDI